MKSEASLNIKSVVRVAFFLCIMCLLSLPAYAHYYDGGDWGGSDLILLDGDSLSGSFVNVGMFSIPAGASISGAGSDLYISAGRITIDGSLNGSSPHGYDLDLISAGELLLNGIIGNCNTISLEAQNIITTKGASITAGAPITAGGSISLTGRSNPRTPPAGTIASGSLTIIARGSFFDDRPVTNPGVLTGGDIRLSPDAGLIRLDGGVENHITVASVPTPVPAAVWLLGSGLLGLAGLRKRIG